MPSSYHLIGQNHLMSSADDLEFHDAIAEEGGGGGHLEEEEELKETNTQSPIIEEIEGSLNETVEEAMLGGNEMEMTKIKEEERDDEVETENSTELSVEEKRAKFLNSACQDPIDIIEDRGSHVIDEALLGSESSVKSISQKDERSGIADERGGIADEHAMVGEKEEENPEPASYWGGMFSALSDITSTVKAKASTLYDAFDPTIEDETRNDLQEEDPKSIKTLLDRLSPTKSSEGEGAFSWLDKTFDRASDRIGQTLMGGIKTIEGTVGIGIEPIVPSSPGSSLQDETMDNNDDGSSSTPHGSTVGLIGKNIYSTLGKLKAGIVQSTAGTLNIGGSSKQSEIIIDRVELKKSFIILFDEFSGNDALEKLQIQSTRASIQLKTTLKDLNPQQLKIAQGNLKGIGSTLDNIEAKEGELDWRQEIYNESEFVNRLQRGIEDSLSILKSIEENVEQLKERVDSPLPPDNPSLLLYLGRYHLAKILSASIHLFLSLSYESTVESDILHLAQILRGKLESFSTLTATSLLEDANRRSAISQLLTADISQAQTLLRDAVLLLQPHLRLSSYLQRQQSVKS